MKFCSRKKCWQMTLRCNCHNKYPFFQEIFSYFQICYLLNDTEWPIFNAYIMLIFILRLHTYYFYFSFGHNVFLLSYLTSLQLFFFHPIKFVNILFCLFRPCNNFFQYISYPPPEKQWSVHYSKPFEFISRTFRRQDQLRTAVAIWNGWGRNLARLCRRLHNLAMTEMPNLLCVEVYV